MDAGIVVDGPVRVRLDRDRADRHRLALDPGTHRLVVAGMDLAGGAGMVAEPAAGQRELDRRRIVELHVSPLLDLPLHVVFTRGEVKANLDHSAYFSL